MTKEAGNWYVLCSNPKMEQFRGGKRHNAFILTSEGPIERRDTV